MPDSCWPREESNGLASAGRAMLHPLGARTRRAMERQARKSSTTRRGQHRARVDPPPTWAHLQAQRGSEAVGSRRVSARHSLLFRFSLSRFSFFPSTTRRRALHHHQMLPVARRRPTDRLGGVGFGGLKRRETPHACALGLGRSLGFLLLDDSHLLVAVAVLFVELGLLVGEVDLAAVDEGGLDLRRHFERVARSNEERGGLAGFE